MTRRRLVSDGTGVIYIIKCAPTGRVYVGQAQTERLLLRWDRHKSDLRKGKHHSLKLQRAWNKYGEESFQFRLIETSVPLSLLTDREQYYMDTHKAYVEGFNCAPNAACTRGVKQSPETIAKRVIKLRKALTGHKLSEETKAKIREKRALQVITPETGQKVREALIGRKSGPNPKKGRGKGCIITQETRDKISTCLMGRKLSDETRQRMREAHARPEVKAKSQKSMSLEQRQLLSSIHKARYAEGAPHPRTGKTHSDESKQKMRESALRRWEKLKEVI